MFTRIKSKKGDERMSGREASPLAGKTRRSYFRSSLSTSSMGGCSESSKPSEEDAEDSERDRRETAAAATVSLKGVLDFPDVVRKLDGEANEGERHVQLGLAKFMAVLDDAPAKDVLAWGKEKNTCGLARYKGTCFCYKECACAPDPPGLQSVSDSTGAYP